MKNELYKYNKDSLSYEKVSFKSIYGLPIVLFIVVNIFIGSSVEKLPRTEIIYDTQHTVIESENEFSYKLLVIDIGNRNFRHPEIVLAQAILETGNFTSDIFKENNNLFGMKAAQNRSHKHSGTLRGHAAYESWEDSVDDYALYYTDRNLKRRTVDEYYVQLKKDGYAEDPKYIEKIKKLADEIRAKGTFDGFEKHPLKRSRR